MASLPKSSTVVSTRRLEVREKLWPGVTASQLWDRKNRDGYATVPRLLPLIMTIINDLSDKGQPAGNCYLELWCRLNDEGYLALSRPLEMAFAAGFTGQRALYTWRDRISKLRDLKFLDVKSGPFGELSFALFWNPYHVLREHHKAGRVHEDKWQALVFRAGEVGATDLDDDLTTTKTSATKSPPKKIVAPPSLKEIVAVSSLKEVS